MKWENGEKERERKRRTAGRSSLAGKTLESLPRRLREVGGRCQLSCKLRELFILIRTEIATMDICWLVMNLVSIVEATGVVACLGLLWK